MFKGIANGLTVMSEKMVELDETAKKAELIGTVKKIDKLERELETQKSKMATLMKELSVKEITWNEKGIELA